MSSNKLSFKSKSP